ncbi:MAG TPA: tetratricopeptide repeat protein, partial [Rhodothermales bacterium]|nr:tetratricopeptide repeat protein [Rhodothermales bacterium]
LHHRTARTRLRLGRCLTDQHRYAEAEPLMIDAFEVFKTVYGIDNAETQRSLEQVITLYEAWGHPEKAIPYQNQLAA